MLRFHFADAFWFRALAKVVLITVTAFALVTISPALRGSTSDDRLQAIFALSAVSLFVIIATTFAVAINDSYVEIDDRSLFVRFESFFSVELPIADIVAVRAIDHARAGGSASASRRTSASAYVAATAGGSSK